MAEISGTATENHTKSMEEGVLNYKDGEQVHHQEDDRNSSGSGSGFCISVSFLQKLIAEVLGTYFLIFAGCASVMVNLSKDKVVTLPGISIVWGLAVMVMVYSVGHISGAHFNPAVTIAFASCRRFPWKQVPAYVLAQILGSTLASGTLRLIFDGNHQHFPGTIPAGSNLQSLVLEFIISFYLMFVISGVATDNRAIGELAGLAVGATVLLNADFRSVDESGEEFGTGDSDEPIQRNMVMAEISGANGNHTRSLEDGFVNLKNSEVFPKVEDWNSPSSASKPDKGSGFCVSVHFFQKLIAEALGTYFLILAGCASVVVNLSEDKVVTHPGIAMVWGLVVMVMVYSVGHISGAHFNPAVTIAFAFCGRFPWKQVPAYVFVQVIGSILASGTLWLIFQWKHDHFPGTIPAGSDVQSLVLEFIITFYLMFVICGVATDNRAIGELAGLAIGATISINVLFAGPISGASMNPARSLGPAIISNRYEGIWVYIVGPICGAITGAWAYNIIRFTNKPLQEITQTASFFKTLGRSSST
ncbi:hypothetical protein HHK36_005192 [Tetracentron sinense]|uniref:Uncharacterized protein n=1 Tax=Tetracentron sinense TaxID=13715 RepID=A0A834ZKQ3_TETSI|nr:hypothetical protein HHK36_005192 [Tetracentron sinense]